MDPQVDLPELIEDLEANIDDLTETLSPLLSRPIHTTVSTLPVLDKAKVCVLFAYAIESLLFSTLQASGVNAKEHPVFNEIARLKGYFGKIKQIEGAGDQPKVKLDKEAAARFIKHGLAGNDRYDLDRAERIAKEKARAALKAKKMNIKFDQAAEDQQQSELSRKRKADEVDAQEEDEQEEDEASDKDDHVESENEDFYGSSLKAAEPSGSSLETQKEHSGVSAPDPMDVDGDNEEAPSVATTPTSAKKRKRGAKKDKKRKIESDSHAAVADDANTAESKEGRKSAKRGRSKRGKGLSKMQSLGGMKKHGEELLLADHQPQMHSDTFNALLDGSYAEQRKEKDQAKKKGKR